MSDKPLDTQAYLKVPPTASYYENYDRVFGKGRGAKKTKKKKVEKVEPIQQESDLSRTDNLRW